MDSTIRKSMDKNTTGTNMGDTQDKDSIIYMSNDGTKKASDLRGYNDTDMSTAP